MTASRDPTVGFWRKWSAFQGLLVTTAISAVLIVGTARNWTIGGKHYEDITNNRATAQLAIQLVSGLLGLIHITVICRLINHASRIYLVKKSSVQMGTLQTWAAMSIPRLDYDVPIQYLLPLLIISSFGLVSSSLWVGALTPVVSSVMETHALTIPSARNTSLIKEYPSEIRGSGPSLTTREGIFTYSVGIKHLGALVVSAASATTADGSVRKHAKLDNTQFFYEGRSYGVGSPVGLTDSNITTLDLATRYTYMEAGYQAHVACMYNSSSDFVIHNEVATRIWEVGGYLPDSLGGPESSEYVGHSSDVIVAMGVAFSGQSPRRFVAIAAGASYSDLDGIQCSIDFTPMLFNVSVGIANRNISVSPGPRIDDFDPERNITRTLMRQFELITNDMTNLYVSVVGDAFMSSVTAYNTSHTMETNATATLRGVENALTAMADDMLAGYAAAQLMVGEISNVVSGDVTMSALVIGQRRYIIAVSVINFVVLLIFLFEAIRTRRWHLLPALDFSDPKCLIAASFRGGSASQQGGGSWGEGAKLIRREQFQEGPYAWEKQTAMRESVVELRKHPENGETALFISNPRLA